MIYDLQPIVCTFVKWKDRESETRKVTPFIDKGSERTHYLCLVTDVISTDSHYVSVP